MKRGFYLLLLIIFCIFTIKIEAKKHRHKKHKQQQSDVILLPDPPNPSFTNAIPSLALQDEQWEWMDLQIEKDFEHIDIISESKLRSDYQNLGNTAIRCYEIKDGIVYGPRDNITDFLEAIIARYPVPNLVFLYAYTDLVRVNFFLLHQLGTPIFSSAKAASTDGKVIHFIDWYYHIALTNTGWNKIILDIDERRAQSSWESKTPVVFWRGGPTTPNMVMYSHLNSFPRGRLVQMSLEFPALIDARFNWLLNPKEQKRFPLTGHVSIPDHLQYKYQLAMDGETATYPGYQWRLYSECLNFKQDSDETLWFYGPLKPYVHYIPVRYNLEDLIEKIEWAKANDDEAQKIAKNARAFAAENLMPEHMLLYGYKVLSMYASKLGN